MKLVINRKEWRRGPQEPEVVFKDPTSLLCKDGTKCCLGFYALQCGLTENAIKGVGEPTDLMFDGGIPTGMEKLVKFIEEDFTYLKMSELTNDAIDINDGRYDTEAEREQALIERFAHDGIEVEFHE